jgi:hypothetical protein
MSRIRADQLVNRAGSGGPKFPNGVAEGFSVSGIVTAASFSGNITGNLTGNVTGNVTGNADTATTATTASSATNAQGLTGTPNITVGTVGCSTVTSSGDVNGVNATFSGNLTVNGTTTTIDTAVTSVDSLAVDGRITGAGITVSGVGDLTVSQSTPAQPANLFLGKGGNSKVFLVDESGNLKIGSNLDSASTTNITLGTNGSADFNSTLRVDHSGNAGSNQLARLGNVNNSGTNSAHLFLANGYYVSPTAVDGTGAAAKILADGTIHDSIGPLRRLGIQGASGSFSFAADMAGKLVRSTGNGSTLTIPQNVFSAGDMISVFNVSTGDNTIAEGTGATLYNSADGATGNRTLGPKGVCTIVCTSTNEFIISGSQVS